jgi:hypothetical protein
MTLLRRFASVLRERDVGLAVHSDIVLRQRGPGGDNGPPYPVRLDARRALDCGSRCIPPGAPRGSHRSCRGD